MAAPYPASQQAVPPQQGNGLAVAGMVLGILGLVLCWIAFVGGICALVGVILSGIGMSKAGKLGGKGKGMAIAGLVCGILGLIMQVVIVFVVMASFNKYIEKAKTTEARIQLRSIEMKAKTFYNEKMRFPKSASTMPGSPGSACSSGGRLQRQPQSAWNAAGWDELGFHVDEDSRYAYEFQSQGNTAIARAIGDDDCDGTLETYELRLDAESGMVRATYSE